MGAPKKPQDLYVQNGWYLEVPGLSSPHFETLEGVQKKANKVSLVDAGTNKKYQFGTQILDFGEITLTRSLQGNADDLKLQALVDDMIENGTKVPVVAVKKHKGRIVYTIIFEGFNIHGYQHSTYDVNGEEKMLITYNATSDDHDVVPVGL